MTGDPSSVPDPEELDRRLAAQTARKLRTRPRETWLVPLLAVPLSRIAVSPLCADDDLRLYSGGQDPARVRESAARVEGLVQATAEADGGHELTDEEAFLLMEFTHDCVGLGCAVLQAPNILLAGLDLPAGLTGDPLILGVARWIASGSHPVPLAALVASQALFMARDPGRYLPRAQVRYAPVTRAIGELVEAEGATTWEHAVSLAHRYWSAGGWLELGLWQMRSMYRFGGDEEFVIPEERAAAARESELRQHRAERKRLQTSASEAQAELRALRPLRGKVTGLREEAERLRLREAALIQARDRAQARAEALEIANRKLEQSLKEATRRLAALSPAPTPAAAPSEDGPRASEVVHADEVDLPADLLAGREVFYFTGQVRRTSAVTAADSLRVLGARDVRAFCVHKGSLGPETFPADAMVIMDIRFVSHTHSREIAERARRSGAQYLAVRSGKGSLARKVAAALEEHPNLSP